MPAQHAPLIRRSRIVCIRKSKKAAHWLARLVVDRAACHNYSDAQGHTGASVLHQRRQPRAGRPRSLCSRPCGRRGQNRPDPRPGAEQRRKQSACRRARHRYYLATTYLPTDRYLSTGRPAGRRPPSPAAAAAGTLKRRRRRRTDRPTADSRTNRRYVSTVRASCSVFSSVRRTSVLVLSATLSSKRRSTMDLIERVHEKEDTVVAPEVNT